MKATGTSTGPPTGPRASVRERLAIKGGQGLLRFLPAGIALPDEVWLPRHRGIVVMLYAHAVGLALFGLYMGWGPLLSLLEGGFVALLAVFASWGRMSRRLRSSVAALAAVASSSILVQFSGGYIEAHFHFFIMVAVIALYQDWVPFLLAVLFVAVDHGVIGTLNPEWVYNHPAAIANPWLWAGIHAALVAGLCVALMALWKSAETAQKRLVEREVTLDRLQHETQFKNSLLANVSHELKTPLTPLRMNVQLLKRGRMGPLEDRQERVVALLDRNLDRLSTLVDQTLDIGRLNADRMELNLQRVDLAGIIKNVVDDYETHARDREVQLVIKSAPETFVDADADRITQVVHNLVSNAVKFTPKGGTVTVETDPREQEARVHVHDTGRGIEPDEKERLFEPFSQIHDTSQMTDAGSGLGLFLGKGIIEAHGGRIWCESPGRAKGSTFSFALPALHKDT